jgi:hypothetical protein
MGASDNAPGDRAKKPLPYKHAIKNAKISRSIQPKKPTLAVSDEKLPYDASQGFLA